MSGFRWTKNREDAAFTLAEGGTVKEAADSANCSERTIYRWQNDPEFAIEVDRLTFMTGVATRAERLRVAKRVVRGRMENKTYPMSRADLLDWIKFLQSETDGANLNLAPLFAAAAQVAGSGPARIDAAMAADTETE